MVIAARSLATVAVTAGPDAWLDGTTSSAQLTAVASDGEGAYTYAWSPPDGLSATDIPNPIASPSVTTSYTVVATDSLGQSGEAYVRAAVRPAAWAPPIGIPSPPFGVTDSHTMYQSATYDFGSGPQPYKVAGNGPYTHYVDNTHPASTDANNPFGSAAKPRKTIPRIVPAGSVVEIHGGPYTLPVPTYFWLQGQRDRPVFLRGAGPTWPRIASDLEILHAPLTGEQANAYAIIENLDIRKVKITAPCDHVALHHCVVRGDLTTGGILLDSFRSLYRNQQVVLYDNVIRDNGNWLISTDQDVHGIKIGRRSDTIWVLDNEIYHNSGDGVQVDAQSLALLPETHHIYLGRNHSHHNKQSGLWTKQATDVIFSQNHVHHHRPIGPTPSAYGSGMGFQYGPERVWFLYNHVHDCSYGISSGSSSGQGNGQYCYLVGNLLHDIRHDPAVDYVLTDPTRIYDPLHERTPGGIALASAVYRYIVNNTIYNADTGITCNEGQLTGTTYQIARHYIHNNLIAEINPPLPGDANGMHIQIEGHDYPQTAQLAEVDYNLLHQADRPVQMRWGGGGAAYICSLAQLRAQFGKGLHCLEQDPAMVNASVGDFHLSGASPAIKAGTSSEVCRTFRDLYGLDINVDTDGTARSWHGPPDIGTDETVYRVRNASRATWYDRIQPALAAVAAGETIVICPGIYRENLVYPLGPDGRGFDFVLSGANPSDWQTVAATVIDGSASTILPVIRLTGDERSATAIEGLTIRKGSRGGVQGFGNAPTIRRCILTDNRNSGGAGGAICGTAGLVEDCMVLNNSARFGGGLQTDGTINRCRIINNVATRDGGGIDDFNGRLLDSVLRLNACSGRGGAVSWGRARIDGCTFRENIAATGGGVHGWWDAAVIFPVSRCIFWANTAVYGNQLAGEGPIEVPVTDSTVQGGQAGVYTTGSAVIRLDLATISTTPPPLPAESSGVCFIVRPYNAVCDQTVLADATMPFTPGQLADKLVYVTGGTWRRVFLVAANSADSITIWGDATGAATYRVLED